MRDARKNNDLTDPEARGLWMIMMIRHHRPSDNDDGFATDDDQMMIICYTDIRHQDDLLSAHKHLL